MTGIQVTRSRWRAAVPRTWMSSELSASDSSPSPSRTRTVSRRRAPAARDYSVRVTVWAAIRSWWSAAWVTVSCPGSGSLPVSPARAWESSGPRPCLVSRSPRRRVWISPGGLQCEPEPYLVSQNSATALPLFRARLQLGVTAGESPEPEPAARRGPCLLVKSCLLPGPESRPSFYHVL